MRACGKRYEVDGSNAGKTGKCAACGERMRIPDITPAASHGTSESEAYQLEQAPDRDRSTSFSPAPGSEDLEEPRSQRRVKKESANKSPRKEAEAAGSRLALPWQTGLIGLSCLVTVALLIAVLVPAARMNIGKGIALAGLILFVYGYGSGARIAFTEDDLYGWLYLLFPPYAAYYFVSRWDEMSSRLVMLIVGLVLLAGGGRMLESVRSADPAEEARAHRVD